MQDSNLQMGSWAASNLVMALRLGIFQVFAFDEHIRQMAGLGIVSVP